MASTRLVLSFLFFASMYLMLQIELLTEMLMKPDWEVQS